MPNVSVIIPAFQAQDTLERAVLSVRAQTFADWELIIVDDGSTDATPDIAKKLSESDQRIRFYSQENQGPAAARNNGVSRANGEYLAFLDADDEWMPYKLDGQVAVLSQYSEIAVVFCDSLNCNVPERTRIAYSVQHGKTLGTLEMRELAPDTLLVTDANLHLAIHRANFINTSTVMVRKQVFMQVGQFNPICRGTEDHDLWIRMARLYSFAYWHLVCAFRYKSPSSVSWRSEAWLGELIRFHRMYLSSPDYHDLHDISSHQLRALYRSLIRYYGRHFRPRRALATFKESIDSGIDARAAMYAITSLVGPLPFTAGGLLSRMITKLLQSNK